MLYCKTNFPKGQIQSALHQFDTIISVCIHKNIFYNLQFTCNASKQVQEYGLYTVEVWKWNGEVRVVDGPMKIVPHHRPEIDVCIFISRSHDLSAVALIYPCSVIVRSFCSQQIIQCTSVLPLDIKTFCN